MLVLPAIYEAIRDYNLWFWNQLSRLWKVTFVRWMGVVAGVLTFVYTMFTKALELLLETFTHLNEGLSDSLEYVGTVTSGVASSSETMQGVWGLHPLPAYLVSNMSLEVLVSLLPLLVVVAVSCTSMILLTRVLHYILRLCGR